MTVPDPHQQTQPGTGGYPTVPGSYPTQPPTGAYPAVPPPTPASWSQQSGRAGYLTGGYPQTGYPTGGYPQTGHPTGGYPTQEQWRPPGRRGLSGGAAIALIAVAVLAVAGMVVVLMSHNKQTPAAAPTSATTSPSAGTSEAPAQAAAIDALLAESEVGRDLLAAAITDINNCRLDSRMWSNLQGAINNRSSLLARTDALQVDAIPEGSVLKPHLRDVFQASYDADIAYQQWVLAASGCPRTNGPGYSAIVNANNRAQAAKNLFLSEWNPVAQRYGLPSRSNTQI